MKKFCGIVILKKHLLIFFVQTLNWLRKVVQLIVVNEDLFFLQSTVFELIKIFEMLTLYLR